MAERKNSEAGPSRHLHAAPAASFPTHNSPRTWLLTQSLSPLAIRLIRLLLAHGDYVVACLPPHEVENEERSAEFRELINECKSSRRDREGWKDRIRGIRCDGRVMGQCGAAVAEAVQVFGRIDILLCCKFEAVVGTVEELSTSPATENLLPFYDSDVNPAPSIREMLTNVLNAHPETSVAEQQQQQQQQQYQQQQQAAAGGSSSGDGGSGNSSSGDSILYRYPRLPAAALDKLVMETVHALTAIGGHENPPARHIVGFEGSIAVKEKLRTVTEELEDFVDASLAVDIHEPGVDHPGAEGQEQAGRDQEADLTSAGP
ncbi:hypothetical protein RB601_006650 [Gaeumannomyces tritici]